jgi:hypothetical protein
MLSTFCPRPTTFRAAALGLVLGGAALSGPAAAGSLIGEFPAFMWPTGDATCTTCAPGTERDDAASQ